MPALPAVILKFLPFRCHSRFCPFCGNMYSIDRTTSMSFKIIHVQHLHCVFTIARELRPLFLQDRSLLNCLFSAVNRVVSRMFLKDNYAERFTPGFICPPYLWQGSEMESSLIHCLVSEGGVGLSLRWRHKALQLQTPAGFFPDRSSQRITFQDR